MKTIAAEELDRMFDDGEDISGYVDFSSARRVNELSQRQINVSMTEQMISALDAEAQRVGVTRQSVIKMWLQERIDAERRSRAAVATA